MKRNQIKLTPAVYNNKWGYLDNSGIWAIKPKFDAAWEFDENSIARVIVNNKVRLINTSGKFIGNHGFDGIEDFDSLGLAKVLKGYKWSLINLKGKLLTNELFDYIGEFSDNGYALIENNGLTGYIDKSGKVVINPQFFDAVNLNSKGYAAVKVCKRWHIIDSYGKSITNAKFDNVSEFSADNIARVIVDNKFGYIDFMGNYLIEPNLEYGGLFGKNSITHIKTELGISLIDTEMNCISGPFSDITDFDCSFYDEFGIIFAKSQEGFWCVIDKYKNSVVSLRLDEYKLIRICESVLFFLKENNTWHIYSADMKEIESPPFGSFRKEFCGIMLSGKNGFVYIDKNGNTLSENIKSYYFLSEYMVLEHKNHYTTIVDLNNNTQTVSDLGMIPKVPCWVKTDVDEIFPFYKDLFTDKRILHIWGEVTDENIVVLGDSQHFIK